MKNENGEIRDLDDSFGHHFSFCWIPLLLKLRIPIVSLPDYKLPLCRIPVPFCRIPIEQKNRSFRVKKVFIREKHWETMKWYPTNEKVVSNK
jgi:hypothetical protein